MTTQEVETSPWAELEKIIDSGHVEHLQAFLHLLPPEETPYTISRLPEEKQNRMFELIAPHLAAGLLDQLEDEHAADVIEDLPPAAAAAIVEEMDSDEKADVLAELEPRDYEAILDEMAPEDAEDARLLGQYAEDTAGGVMHREFVAYPRRTVIDDVIGDLRLKAEEYEYYDVHYFYVTDEDGHLMGVARLRDMVLARGDHTLERIMIREPTQVNVNTGIADLEDLFDRSDFSSVPVVDDDGKLLGVADRAAVEEALGEEAEANLMKFGGIIGGEELRSMALRERLFRRLLFLCPNILLSLVSVMIIAAFEPTIARITALAVFLPLVANLSGASGNQAVAVSIRELALGLVKPVDVIRVFRKEVFIGLLNGLMIGLILGCIALVMRTDMPGLALIVGGAFTLTSVLAVTLGGSIPLLLKAMGTDPAMASSPILTTLTDMCSFFIVLAAATLTAPLLLS